MVLSYAVALPNGSKRNLDVGLANSVWGWKDSALDQSNRREGRRRREIAAAIRPGDHLVLSIGGPGRTASWNSATLRRAILAEVTTGLYRSTTTVWPDELYPNRVNMHLLEAWTDVDAHRIGLPAMQTLRWSFQSQSTPCLIPVVDDLRFEMPPTQDQLLEADKDLVAGDFLNDNGTSLDAATVGRRRREQAELRRRLFGGRSLVECALCGRSLPPSLLRAAHIKKRAEADDAERRNMANLMPACALGCDELFERGLVTIASDGRIEVDDTGVKDLAAFVAHIDGRTAGIDVTTAGPFLTWHRQHHGGRT